MVNIVNRKDAIIIRAAIRRALGWKSAWYVRRIRDPNLTLTLDGVTGLQGYRAHVSLSSPGKPTTKFVISAWKKKCKRGQGELSELSKEEILYAALRAVAQQIQRRSMPKTMNKD